MPYGNTIVTILVSNNRIWLVVEQKWHMAEREQRHNVVILLGMHVCAYVCALYRNLSSICCVYVL